MSVYRNRLVTCLFVTCLGLICSGVAMAQASRPPLPPAGPRLSPLGQANRQNQALQDAPNLVARLLIRFQNGDLTTSLIKSNPHGFRVSADSNGLKLKGLARGEKPQRTEARSGYLQVAADWNISAQRRRAKCRLDDFADGFHEILFLRGSDTTDKEQDNFICRFSYLPLPAEDLKAWIAEIPAESVDGFNACSEASGNSADDKFWQCITATEIPMPALTAETAKRIKGLVGG